MGSHDYLLPRRDFLRLGSVAVAGLAASGVFSPALFAANEPAIVPLLSVGYAPIAPANNGTVRLDYASSLIAGDPAFLSKMAKVTIEGYARGRKYQGNLSGTALDAIYPVHGYTPDKYPHFWAFFYAGQNGEERASGPLRFTLPVTSNNGAQFLVRRLKSGADSGNGQGATPERSLLSFSLGVESGSLKLQRGVYVIAFRESGSDDAPNWAGYTLRRTNGMLTVPNAPFSYVIVSFAYAK